MNDERKEYKMGRMSLGQTKADMVYVDNGESMKNKMSRSVTERDDMTQRMLTEISGASGIDSIKLRTLHGKILAAVIQVVDEGPSEGTLIIPGRVQTMQRHRALTLDGRVIFFHRGAGELVRLGGAGHESEWVILEPKDIIAELDGVGLKVTGNYVIFKRLPTPQQVSTIVQIDDATRRQIWYLGEVWGLPEKAGELMLFHQIIADVSNHTMISHMGHTFIVVPFDDVMGIYTPPPQTQEVADEY